MYTVIILSIIHLFKLHGRVTVLSYYYWHQMYNNMYKMSKNAVHMYVIRKFQIKFLSI